MINKLTEYRSKSPPSAKKVFTRKTLAVHKAHKSNICYNWMFNNSDNKTKIILPFVWHRPRSEDQNNPSPVNQVSCKPRRKRFVLLRPSAKIFRRINTHVNGGVNHIQSTVKRYSKQFKPTHAKSFLNITHM